VNGVYDGPYDPNHQAPEVTYGPEYKSGTPSESAYPSAPDAVVPEVVESPFDYNSTVTDMNNGWIDNGDGTYTAKKGATLLGLSQQTGKDWRDTDYSGKPEELQEGQIVRFKGVADKLDIFTSDISDFTGTAGGVAKQFGKSWFTAGSPTQIPLKTLEDPDLMSFSKNMDGIGKGMLILGLGLDLYNGIQKGIETQSFWHGAYSVATKMTSTIAGYEVGNLVTGLLTSGTSGWGAVPGVIAGAGAGVAVSKGIDAASNYFEGYIWKE
jgi:hypothetical protein